MTSQLNFTLGGAIGPHGLYVERAADTLLFKALSSFESCYIAHPRQSGKSSLRKHTAARLREAGFAVVEIDLTRSANYSSERFWRSFEQDTANELARLEHRAKPWDRDRDDGQGRSLDAYIVEDVLPLHEQGLIFILDEINVLGTRNDSITIFTELRALIERRARCSLCFLGVSQPSDLVTEPAADPTPLMRAVALDDFTREEVAAFAPLLAGFRDPRRIMDACFEQTGGHPYMLQRVLAAAAESRAASANDEMESAAALIAEVVQARFFNPASPDPVLEAPHHAFSQALDHRAIEALNIYRSIVVKGRISVEGSERQQLHELLRLTGMIRFDSSSIVPRNAIFARRYNLGWIRDRLDRISYEIMATSWQLDDCNQDFLLRGSALASATELLHKQDLPVSALVAEFIRASVKLSDQLDLKLTRLSRRFGVSLVMVLLIGVFAFVTALRNNRILEARSEAAERAFEAQRAVADKTKASLDALSESYKTQLQDVESEKTSLNRKLVALTRQSDDLASEKERLTRAYNKAVDQGSQNARLLREQLMGVEQQITTLATEKTRLEGDLTAARQRELALVADRKQADGKIKTLDAELAALKQRDADLNAQLTSLKKNIDDANKQLGDVQGKYAECTKQLSDTRTSADDAKSRAAACEGASPKSMQQAPLR